jgi:signal peptidase I
MGDNRGNSNDSRFFGPIGNSQIVGRTIWRVWPLGHLSFL